MILGFSDGGPTTNAESAPSHNEQRVGDRVIRLIPVFGPLVFFALLSCSGPKLTYSATEWEYDLGQPIAASPSVLHDGNIVAAGLYGETASIDPSGREVWKTDVPAEVGAADRFFLPPVVTENDRILIVSAKGWVYCLDGRSGKLIWVEDEETMKPGTLPVLGPDSLYVPFDDYSLVQRVRLEDGAVVGTLDLSDIAPAGFLQITYFGGFSNRLVVQCNLPHLIPVPGEKDPTTRYLLFDYDLNPAGLIELPSLQNDDDTEGYVWNWPVVVDDRLLFTGTYSRFDGSEVVSSPMLASADTLGSLTVLTPAVAASVFPAGIDKVFSHTTWGSGRIFTDSAGLIHSFTPADMFGAFSSSLPPTSYGYSSPEGYGNQSLYLTIDAMGNVLEVKDLYPAESADPAAGSGDSETMYGILGSVFTADERVFTTVRIMSMPFLAPKGIACYEYDPESGTEKNVVTIEDKSSYSFPLVLPGKVVLSSKEGVMKAFQIDTAGVGAQGTVYTERNNQQRTGR